jgi:hypothetical protein
MSTLVRGPGGYRFRALAIGWVLAVTLGASIMGCAVRNNEPELIVGESVASDFRLVAEETWASFLEVFRARADCFGPVTLQAERSLESRAVYDPGTATVTVRVPATPAILRGALVHEFAHHVEFQCQEHMELRPVFLGALGLPADTEWRPGSGPAGAPSSVRTDVPSEQYAEATVNLVLGRRPVTTGVRVSDEAIRAVQVWATGK